MTFDLNLHFVHECRVIVDIESFLLEMDESMDGLQSTAITLQRRLDSAQEENCRLRRELAEAKRGATAATSIDRHVDSPQDYHRTCCRMILGRMSVVDPKAEPEHLTCNDLIIANKELVRVQLPAKPAAFSTVRQKLMKQPVFYFRPADWNMYYVGIPAKLSLEFGTT